MTIPRQIIHQTLACSPVILEQFMIGVGWGWIAPTLMKLSGGSPSPFGFVTVEHLSWLASINEMGRLLGPILSAALLVDNIGRRYTLFLISVMYFVVWLSIIFVRNIYLLFAARVGFGLANGINNVVTGVYTTENCSPNFRGIIASVTTLTHYIGIFFGSVVATYLSYEGTAIVNTAMAACVFATLYFGTETPYFLIMKGRRAQAEANLIWLSGNASGVEVADELHQIEESVSAEKLKTESFKLLFFSSANRRGILIVVGVHLLHVMAGPAVYVTYTSLVFKPSQTLTTDHYTILFGAAQLLAVAISPFIIEKMGRRSLIIGTFAGATVGNVCSYALIYLRNKGYEVAYYPWLIFASISLCAMLIAIGTPGINSVRGELLPLSVRAIGSSLAVTAHSITTFSIIKVFLPLTTHYGMESNFMMYSVVGFLGVVLFFFVLPETRGKTLYELQNMDKAERVLLREIPGEKIEKKYIFRQ